MWALQVSLLNFLQLHLALPTRAYPKSTVTCSLRLAPSYRRYRQARVYRKPQDRSYTTPISTLTTSSYPSTTRPSCHRHHRLAGHQRRVNLLARQYKTRLRASERRDISQDMCSIYRLLNPQTCGSAAHGREQFPTLPIVLSHVEKMASLLTDTNWPRRGNVGTK